MRGRAVEDGNILGGSISKVYRAPEIGHVLRCRRYRLSPDIPTRTGLAAIDRKVGRLARP